MPFLIPTVLLLLSFLSLTSPVIAALIVVPDEAPTIQDAITGAASGDSILVRAGTYAESLTLTGKNVTIFGESGAEATAITGSSAVRILEVTGPNVTTATVVENLTFQDGKAPQGAGIRLTNGASLTLGRCRFLRDQALGTGGIVAGGAVFVDAGSTLLAEDCLFQDNRAAYTNLSGDAFGGAIQCTAGSRIEVRQSEFINNSTSGFEGGWGGGINVHGVALVEDCRLSAGFGSEGAGIRAGRDPGAMGDAELVARRCVFDGNFASLFGAAGIHCFVATITLESNTFFSNGGPALLAYYSKGTITHNTMCFNGPGLDLLFQGQAPLLVSNNVVSNNSIGVRVSGTPPPGWLACNDVWSNQSGNYSGIPDPTGTNGNLSADPLFCNAPARDFTLNALSPCAPGQSPPGCGLIGAWPVACGVTFVDEAPPAAAGRLAVHPNPIRESAQFTFDRGTGAERIEIFDNGGRLVTSLPARGRRVVSWNPSPDLPVGVYFARLAGHGDPADPIKIVILR
jgi:hypothetical protein